MRRRASRGSALIEFCVVIPAVVAIVTTTLGAGYLVFARSWLEYQTEQTLFCLAEGEGPASCRRTFTRRARRALPFGRITTADASRSGKTWRVKVCWRIDAPVYGPDAVRIDLSKELTVARIVRTAVR